GRSIRRGFKTVFHRNAGKRVLFDAFVDLGHFQSADFQDRGDDVGGMVILIPNLAACLNALGPRDNHGIAGATGVFRVAFEHFERSRGSRGPSSRVVFVGIWSAQFVYELHVLSKLVRITVEELVFVDRAAGAAFSGSAVVGAIEDERVFELSAL